MNSASVDSQIRNFKDFLLLYNKVTELCFSSCVDNFFSRSVGDTESKCVDKCVTKFARFNQSMMNVYVEVQTDINNRRMKELEDTAKEAEAKANAVASAGAAVDMPIATDNTSTSTGSLIENLPNAS